MCDNDIYCHIANLRNNVQSGRIVSKVQVTDDAYKLGVGIALEPTIQELADLVIHLVSENRELKQRISALEASKNLR